MPFQDHGVKTAPKRYDRTDGQVGEPEHLGADNDYWQVEIENGQQNAADAEGEGDAGGGILEGGGEPLVVEVEIIQADLEDDGYHGAAVSKEGDVGGVGRPALGEQEYRVEGQKYEQPLAHGEDEVSGRIVFVEEIGHDRLVKIKFCG